MAKTTAWLVTIVGLLLVPPIMTLVQGMSPSFDIYGWLMAVLVLAIGITKLIRNYSTP